MLSDREFSTFVQQPGLLKAAQGMDGKRVAGKQKLMLEVFNRAHVSSPVDPSTDRMNPKGRGFNPSPEGLAA